MAGATTPVSATNSDQGVLDERINPSFAGRRPGCVAPCGAGGHRADQAQSDADHHVCPRGANLDRSPGTQAGSARARPVRRIPGDPLNTQDVCLLVTGMGQTNAAASTLALALSPKFDLRQSYFLIAGIAGISPKHGTIGTAAWAHYLVEFGTQWEIDSRDAPKDWPTGYIGINTKIGRA